MRAPAPRMPSPIRYTPLGPVENALCGFHQAGPVNVPFCIGMARYHGLTQPIARRAVRAATPQFSRSGGSMTPNSRVSSARISVRRVLRPLVIGLLAAVYSLTLPSAASASLLSPENEDKLAGFLSVFILFVVPVVLIVLFWMVHVLPEKIAHKRHHPQIDAIRTLCFLSLVFGGLLWPLAWIWAYSKPVGYKLAYGTDKHPDYFEEHEEDTPALESGPVKLGLRDRLAQLEGRGVPAAELKALRADLDAIEARVAQVADSEAR